MTVELDFNEERFLKLLANLIGETKYLQDNPPKFIPEENRYHYMSQKSFQYIVRLFRAVKHLVDVLQPYTKEKGGLLHVDHVTYVEGRGNLVIGYDNVSVLHYYEPPTSHVVFPELVSRGQTLLFARHLSIDNYKRLAATGSVTVPIAKLF